MLSKTQFLGLVDVTRQTWDPGERVHPRAGSRPLRLIRGVEVHWAGSGGNLLDAGDTAAEVLSFERYHEKTKGWSDLFYNLAVDADGTIFEGRDITVTSQRNTKHWVTLLCVAGTGQTATKTQLDAFARAIHRVWQAVDPMLNSKNLRTHRDRGGSECPGAQLTQLVYFLKNGWVPDRTSAPRPDPVKIARVPATPPPLPVKAARLPRPAPDSPVTPKIVLTPGKSTAMTPLRDLSAHEDAKAARSRGFWNGKDGDQPASRSVAAVMVNRGANYARPIVGPAGPAGPAGAPGIVSEDQIAAIAERVLRLITEKVEA